MIRNFQINDCAFTTLPTTDEISEVYPVGVHINDVYCTINYIVVVDINLKYVDITN